MVGYIVNEDAIRIYFKIAAIFLFSTAAILIIIYSTIFYKIKKTHKNHSIVSFEYNCLHLTNLCTAVYERTFARILVIDTGIIFSGNTVLNINE